MDYLRIAKSEIVNHSVVASPIGSVSKAFSNFEASFDERLKPKSSEQASIRGDSYEAFNSLGHTHLEGLNNFVFPNLHYCGIFVLFAAPRQIHNTALKIGRC